MRGWQSRMPPAFNKLSEASLNAGTLSEAQRVGPARALGYCALSYASWRWSASPGLIAPLRVICIIGRVQQLYLCS